MRRGAKAVTATVVAGRPVARKSQAPSTLAASALEQRLAEALEREAATSEILRIISQSPTDVQPVFDTISAAALKLCSASSAAVFTFDGKLIELSAFANVSPELAVVVRRHFPRPPGRDNAATRAILTRRVVAIPDVLEDPDYAIRATPAVTATRSVLSVPLIRNGLPLGAISVGRPEPGPFSDKEIALLQTFADQAVIAIANVRLFDEVQARTRELAESLQQQTATADVLKIISRSAFDLQTVLDTLTESACTLCEAEGSVIWRPAGDGFKAAAMFGQSPAHRAAVKQLVIKPGRDTCAGRALLEGRTVHIPDAMADPEYNVPEVLKVAGNRAMLGVPLLREGAPIGVLVLTRSVARPFTEKQIALATTFADQAVIAIENVRLFNELEARNRDLTSTSEILRVISTSPTDARPVFDAIVKNAVRLCEARFGAVFRLDGGLVHLAAHHNLSEALRARWKGYPMTPNRGHVSGRTILTGAAVQVPDILADDEYLGAGMKASGFRSLLGVPLLRDGRAIGAIVIYRAEPGQFGDKHIELLQTFADQAVIAIENVRLFNETKEALEQQQASGEVLATISSSIADTKPVFEKILQSCERLFAGTFVTINALNDDGLVQAVAHHGPKREEYLKSDQPAPVDETTATGICMIRRSMLHFPDIEDAAVPPGTRSAGRRSGFRSALVAPML